MSSLCQVIRRTMQVRGKHVATRFADRERTWEEIGERVARLGGALRGLGVNEGDRVAILSLNSDRYYEYYFAVPWAGAVFVPLNT
jgi:long-chain acyl-CoA synthetase